MKIINNKTKIVMGEGSLDYLKKYENKNILIVTDKFLSTSNLMELVNKNLKNKNTVFLFDNIKSDPNLETVGEAIKSFLKNNIEIIIAFGGGSVIDTAKGIIYFAKELVNRKFKLIAIPTTSGTGSEVTSVTVLKDDSTNIKHLLQSIDILPNVAILDSILTKKLPKKIIANTGIDVFTHSIEAYVATGANLYSDSLSEKSGEIVAKHLYKSYIGEEESRDKMHIASMLAGMAFENAGLGINHSIAHQIGAQFKIAHGLANGLLLEEVIKFNAKDIKIKEKYAQYSRKIGLTTNCNDNTAFDILLTFIKVLQEMMEMPKNLSECKVTKLDYYEKINSIVKNALKDNCIKTTPVEIEEKEIKSILDAIF